MDINPDVEAESHSDSHVRNFKSDKSVRMDTGHTDSVSFGTAETEKYQEPFLISDSQPGGRTGISLRASTSYDNQQKSGYIGTTASVSRSKCPRANVLYPQRNSRPSDIQMSKGTVTSSTFLPQREPRKDSWSEGCIGHLTSSEMNTLSEVKLQTEDHQPSAFHSSREEHHTSESSNESTSFQTPGPKKSSAPEDGHLQMKSLTSSYGKVPNTTDIASQLAAAESKKDICKILLSCLNVNRPTGSPDSINNSVVDNEDSCDNYQSGLGVPGTSEKFSGSPLSDNRSEDEEEYFQVKSEPDSSYEEEFEPKVKQKKKVKSDRFAGVKIPRLDAKAFLVDNREQNVAASVMPEVVLPIGKTSGKSKKKPSDKVVKKTDSSSDVRLGSLFFDAETLYSLLIEEKSETEFMCKNCKEVVATKEKAVSHMDVHHPFKCSVCGLTFSTVGDLREHRRNVHKEVLYCTQCSFSTPMITRLEKHVKEEHAPRESPMSRFEHCICYICGQTFTVWDSVDKHMEEVHGIKNIVREGDFKCPICDNISGTMTAFRTHMMKHAGLFKYCKFEGCQFKSVLQRQVDRHYDQVHLGKRLYPCPFEGCNMTTKKKGELTIHLNLSHYKIRNFKCDRCDKGFMAKKHLLVHMRIHSDAKPVACKYCDYRCRQKSALNWHMKKHHPEVVEDKVKVTYDCTPGVPAYRHQMKPGRKGSKKLKGKAKKASCTETRADSSGNVCLSDTINMGISGRDFFSSEVPFSIGQAADSQFIAQEVAGLGQRTSYSGEYAGDATGQTQDAAQGSGQVSYSFIHLK